MEEINKRYSLDVANIFRCYGKEYLTKHQLCLDQNKAFMAITNCRTSAMGGHVEKCDQCSHQQIAYNSCRNRNCNKCQYTKQLIWIDKLKSALPVCRYFHTVFTIPGELHKIFYLNQRICYNLLFKAASQTLRKVALNPTFLGAQPGAVAVLHTWGQALTYHPHIHMLIPGGGLSEDETEWIRAGKKFFLPVKALSKVFRGVLWSFLYKHMVRGDIKMPEHSPDPTEIKKLLYAKNWNVYTKKSLAGPESVVRYLGKYTHRIAISNNRIVSIANGKVTFRWKDYRKRIQKKLLSLDAEEFITRFMRHVLPSGFYKIRYYGFLASANGDKREKCMVLIDKPAHVPLLQGMSTKEALIIITGKPPDICPKCKKGKMIPKTILDPV